MTDARPQDILTPITESAIFLTVCVDPGGEEVAKELLPDLGGLRRTLAAEHGADACCPVTVQRHLVTIAETASAPYWRMVDPDRPFARRLAGGPEAIRRHLSAER